MQPTVVAALNTTYTRRKVMSTGLDRIAALQMPNTNSTQQDPQCCRNIFSSIQSSSLNDLRPQHLSHAEPRIVHKSVQKLQRHQAHATTRNVPSAPPSHSRAFPTVSPCDTYSNTPTVTDSIANAFHRETDKLTRFKRLRCPMPYC